MDNFLEIKKINNCLISSLTDEPGINLKFSVGVLQLYNKLSGDLSDDDAKRVLYLRKLIGSATQKCEIILMTLQTVLGINDDEQEINNSELPIKDLGQQEGLKLSQVWIERA